MDPSAEKREKFRYINNVLSPNNFKFGDYVNRISIEHAIKNTTKTKRSASYLDLHLEIEGAGGL